jgi:hypothetical protein
MAFHRTLFGSTDLPDLWSPIPPRHRSDGVRVVRRPRPVRPEARS